MLAPRVRFRKDRKHLSADGMLTLVRCAFEQISEHRRPSVTIPLADALMSAFAMFSLKDPSLLAFEQRRNDENMRRIYRLGRIPSDSQMRSILDPIDPLKLRPVFNDLLRPLQRGKVLEQYEFLNGAYLLSSDGTGYFSSKNVHCPCCQEKVDSKTGEITYSHQMLGAALVHPDLKEVIPFAPEAIVKQDGNSKNDCERNATGRLMRRIRQEHPHLKLIVVEDGLASNAPHIRDLQELGYSYILGAKPGDHEFLFHHLGDAFDDERVQLMSWTDQATHCELSFVNGLPLNKSNQDLLVNVLQYMEFDNDGESTKRFTWVTDLIITRANAKHLMRGGRARWRIENETFNTLKNQGYHFEHNYGHGCQNLSVVLATLMMLAFLVNQIEQLCCPVFRAAWKKVGTKRALWDHVRSHYRHFVISSMRQLYEAITYDLAKNIPMPTLDTT